MNCGLDYGTSNIEVGVWKANAPFLITLDAESTSMPSAMYTDRAEIRRGAVDGRELSRRITQARAAEAQRAKEAEEEGREFVALGDERLRAMVLGSMRREAAEAEARQRRDQSVSEALSSTEGDEFGSAAIRKYLRDPDQGLFFKSPKTFLGAELSAGQIDTFSEIVTRMIARVKFLAETELKRELTELALGKPVHFHGTRGKAGDAQARTILERAAFACGFQSVEFLYEPVAAALDFERSLTDDKIVLVVDLGGGTADCSVVSVGPGSRDSEDRTESILGYAGERLGGNDLDIKLAFSELMKHFGRLDDRGDGRPVPATLFWDAASINDLPAQDRFRRSEQQIRDFLGRGNTKLARLETLRAHNLSHRLVRSAELTKIHLSDHELANVPLRYIEDGLVVKVSAAQFAGAVQREIKRFQKLIDECRAQAASEIDVVYVTGGTAKSPLVRRAIEKACPSTQIVIGDLFGSVASGLATWAERIYGRPSALQ